jgi:hypothetical protein
MQLRKNTMMAQVIENGLVVDEVSGSEVAWSYLVEHEVPTPIILRVLISASRRRQTDPSHAPSR